MTQHEVDAFLTVCRRGSISRAAEELFISQSSLSARLKALEGELGCTLFQRQRGRHAVTLTEVGQRFYDLALQYQELLQKMYAVAGEGQEKLRVTSANSVGAYLLPPVYRRFLRRCPQVRLEVQEMDVDTMDGRLARQETDLALTTLDVAGKIPAHPLLSEELVFLCQKGASYPPVIQWQDLSVSREVFINWCDDFYLWHRSAFGGGNLPRITLETMEQLQFFLSQPDAWAVVPASVARSLQSTNRFEVRPAAFSLPRRALYLLCLPTVLERPSVQQFLACLREELTEANSPALEILF